MVEERYGEDELRRGGSTVIEPIRTILAKREAITCLGEWIKGRVFVKELSNPEHSLKYPIYRALGPRSAQKLGLIT